MLIQWLKYLVTHLDSVLKAGEREKTRWKTTQTLISSSEYTVILPYYFWFEPNCFKLSFEKLTKGRKENLQPVLSRHFLFGFFPPVFLFVNVWLFQLSDKFNYSFTTIFLYVEIRKAWSVSEILNTPLSYRKIGIYWLKSDSFCVSFQCMLEKVGNWNFDIFLFDRLTNGEFTFSI